MAKKYQIKNYIGRLRFFADEMTQQQLAKYIRAEVTAVYSEKSTTNTIARSRSCHQL
jgi:hypothetical protein